MVGVGVVLVFVLASSSSGFFADTATFFAPGFGEVAVGFLATPFCCTFRTAGEVAVVFGASEVRVVVDGLVPLVAVVLVAAAGLVSSGFLAASVLAGFAAAVPVPVVLVTPIRDAVLLVVVELVFVDFVTPSVVVVPLVIFVATVRLAAVVVVALAGFEGTDEVEMALEGREVTVRVVVPVVDSRELGLAAVVVPVEAGLGAAVLVVELALAGFVVLDGPVAAAFVLAAATDEAAVVVLVVAVLAASVAGFFAASGALEVALAGRASFTPLVVAAAPVGGFAVVVVVPGTFLAAGTVGFRLAADVGHTVVP